MSSIPTINELLNQKLNIVTSYKMLLLRDIIQNKVDEKKNQEHSLIVSYIKRNPDGSPVYVVDKDGKEEKDKYQLTNQEELQKKLNELREEDIDLELTEIPLSQLKDATIEPAKLPRISWLIDPNG
jgi:hypothetical protein